MLIFFKRQLLNNMHEPFKRKKKKEKKEKNTSTNRVEFFLNHVVTPYGHVGGGGGGGIV